MIRYVLQTFAGRRYTVTAERVHGEFRYWLTGLGPAPVALFLSIREADEIGQQALERGFDDYRVRPFDVRSNTFIA